MQRHTSQKRTFGAIRFNRPTNSTKYIPHPTTRTTDRRRIVVFVGSPIETEEKDLVKLGKKFAKDGIAVDVVRLSPNVGQQFQM